jgi:hypothetical protein
MPISFEVHMDDAKLARLCQLYEAGHDLLTLADFIDTIEQIEDYPAAAIADRGTWAFIKGQ